MALGVSINGVGLKTIHRRTRGYLSQNPVSQNTWYTILNTKDDVSLWIVSVNQTNTETDAKTIEVRATINGNVLTPGSSSQANNATIYWVLDPSGAATLPMATTATGFVGPYGKLFAGEVKLEMRTTDVPGTNQTLVGVVYHGQTDLF